MSVDPLARRWARQARNAAALNASYFGIRPGEDVDNTAAILDAIQALPEFVPEFDGYRMGMAELVFGPGVFRITQSGLLSDLGAGVTGRAGFKLRGQGLSSTVLWLDTDDADAWFYDNGATRRTAFSVFEDLMFSGGTDWRNGNPTTDAGYDFSNLKSNINGFRFTGPGSEDGHMFTRCGFRWLQQVAEYAGSNNADTHRFTDCLFQKCDNVFHINNAQSMSISDVGGYAALFGDYLTYGAISGGGNFTKVAGCIIQTADTSSGGPDEDAYVIKTVDGGPGASNSPVLFTGVRFELRGEKGKLAKATAAIGCHIQFDGCGFQNNSAANKEIVELGGLQRLTFDRCTISDTSTGDAQYKITSSERLARNPHLIFTGCDLEVSIWDNITWNGGCGRVTIDDKCSSVPAGASSTNIAIAADVLGTSFRQSVANRAKRQFEAPICNNDAITHTGEHVITLPPRVEIREVWAKFEANAGAASPVQIHIGNDDKSITYATSAVATFDQGNSCGAMGIFKNVGTDAEDRKVRIWLTNGAGSAPSSSINAATVPMRSGVVWV